MSIRQGLSDPRRYQTLTLNNGLSLLLIEDMLASRAACAVSVACGHFDDPKQRPGLTHLLEHLLFLGTEPYPRAGSYHKFIESHGGHHNAWTGTEQSCYFLEIDNDAFDDALAQFGPFFYAPLLEAEWVERERQTIDAEFLAKRRDESRRLLDVHKATVNPDHPFSRFSVGNAATLAGSGRQLSAELRQHFDRYFHAGNLRVVLIAPLPLQQLEWLAHQHFSALRPAIERPALVLPPLYRPQDLGVRIDVTPIKQLNRLSLSFPLPPQQAHYRHKPTELIAHLCGEESPTSLLAALRQRGWASQLHAGLGVRGSNYCDFSLDLLLTRTGASNYQAVVEQLFAHLELIRKQGLEAWRYQERAQLLQQQFDYPERGKSADLAQQLALNMLIYPTEDLLYGDYAMSDFVSSEAEALLQQMIPENCRLLRLLPELNAPNISPWYETPYQLSPLGSAELQNWHKPGPLLSSVALPAANPFIADRLYPVELSGAEQPHPQRLVDQPGLRLWHHQDHQFRLPKGYVYISLDSPHVDHQPRHIAMLRLAVELRNEELSDLTCPAEAAGLNHVLYAHQCGFTLSVGGFTARQPQLIDALLQRIWQRPFNAAHFEQCREQLLRNWRNSTNAPPLTQLFAELSALVQPSSPLPTTLADALETITPSQLSSYLAECEQQVHLEMLVSGDWQASDAQALGHNVAQRIFKQSSPGNDCARELINIGGYGSLVHQRPLAHNDSALVVYYQSRLATPAKVALFAMLNHLIASPFFHELRTRRQLGYMIGTGYLPMNRHPGLVCYLQSPTVSPTDMLAAVDEFLGRFGYAVMEMSEAQWQQAKQTLANQFTESDNNLRLRAQQQWVSIGNKDFSFNQQTLVAAAIDNLDRNELLAFIMDRLKKRGSDRVVIAGFGQKHATSTPIREGITLNRTEEFRLTAERFVIR